MWGKLDPADDYLISIDGQVRSTWFGKEKPIKPVPNGDGYLHFGYCKNGKRTNKLVHRCVAIVFLGDRSAEGLYALHKDGNRLNNKKENLYWGTPAQNQADREKHGTSNRGEKNPSSKLKAVDIPAIRVCYSIGMTMQEIAFKFGVGRTTIANIINRRKWAHVQSPSVGN